MYRVLIVDDEMPALRFVQSIIERFATNFQVAGVATSGEQGFQLLEQQMFDLLITDTGISDDQVQLLKAYGVKEIVRVEPVLSPIDYDPITAMR